MWPQANQLPRPVVVEISRLESRLVTAQYLRGILIPHLDNIKSQFITQKNDVDDIRSNLILAHQQSRALLTENRSEEHLQKLRYIAQKERDLVAAIARRDKSEESIGRVTQEIRDKGDEIMGLENRMNELRTGRY